MANQRDTKVVDDKKITIENDMHAELDRIIKRAKDENEALNNVLKKMSAGNEKESNAK